MTALQKTSFGMTGILLALTVGCSTMGYDRADKMSDSMQKTRADVLEARSQVTATFNALDTVMKAEVGDLRPLVDAYSKELSALDTSAQSARSRAQSIQATGDSYFTAWAQEIEQIQDPQIRASSLKRHSASLANYKAVEKSLFAVRDAYNPVITACSDIESVLRQDLTTAGVAAIKPSAKAAREKAVALQKQMTQSLSVIDRVVADLAPVPSGTL